MRLTRWDRWAPAERGPHGVPGASPSRLPARLGRSLALPTSSLISAGPNKPQGLPHFRRFPSTPGLTHAGSLSPETPASRLLAQISAIAFLVPTVALAMWGATIRFGTP